MPNIERPFAETLPDNAAIWRFMSLAKFISMITTSSLWFSRVDVLRKNDPFELSLTKSNKIDLGDERYLETINNLKFFAELTYVNCWHISEHETAFLWNVYSSFGDGVCIKSTVGKVRECLINTIPPNFQSVMEIGRVRYIDFSVDDSNYRDFSKIIFLKRESFKPENELRLYFIDTNIGCDGKYVCCDIANLIDEIRISPTCPKWYLDAVSKLISSLGFSFVVRQSSITEPALF